MNRLVTFSAEPIIYYLTSLIMKNYFSPRLLPFGKSICAVIRQMLRYSGVFRYRPPAGSRRTMASLVVIIGHLCNRTGIL
jgi:hypothetical protein